MTPASLLAWTFLGWKALSIVWFIVEKPVETKFKSKFYVLVALAVELTLITAAIFHVT